MKKYFSVRQSMILVPLKPNPSKSMFFVREFSKYPSYRTLKIFNTTNFFYNIDPPQLININYPRKNITVGDDIQFECNFAGNPEPKIRWSFTDAITKNLHHLKSSDENPRILVIKNATYMNEGCCFDEFLESKYKPFLYLSGDYYCHGINYNSILNKEITVPSSKFAINVVGKPLFLNVIYKCISIDF